MEARDEEKRADKLGKGRSWGVAGVGDQHGTPVVGAFVWELIMIHCGSAFVGVGVGLRVFTPAQRILRCLVGLILFVLLGILLFR